MIVKTAGNQIHVSTHMTSQNMGETIYSIYLEILKTHERDYTVSVLRVSRDYC